MSRFAQRPPDSASTSTCNTPARYLWTPELDGRGASPVARLASPVLHGIDRRRARERARFAANSDFVRRRVERAWAVDARVVLPPVDTQRIVAVRDWRTQLGAAESALVASLPDARVLGTSRFIPYKRLDWVIRAAERVGLPAVIAGSGPEEARLRAGGCRLHRRDRPGSAAIPADGREPVVRAVPCRNRCMGRKPTEHARKVECAERHIYRCLCTLIAHTSVR